MTTQFDIIIVGDSKEGYTLVKTLATNLKLKIAFVSSNFKHKTIVNSLNVDYLKDTVIFTDYKNRLFGCYLLSGARLYCTHLIIASGVEYDPFKLNGEVQKFVFTTADELTPTSKYEPAIVLGNDAETVKMALTLAKKYQFIYLCTPSMELKATKTLLKKLSLTKNIVVLPNASLTKINTKEKMLIAHFTNYSTISCTAIYCKTAAQPSTNWVSDKLIAKTAEGFLITNESSESEKVPKCFAVGKCTNYIPNNTLLNISNIINLDFNGGAYVNS